MTDHQKELLRKYGDRKVHIVEIVEAVERAHNLIDGTLVHLPETCPACEVLWQITNPLRIEEAVCGDNAPG